MDISKKDILAAFDNNYPAFWADHGNDLVRRLYNSGVPIYADEPGSRWGINLCQVRYKGNHGQGEMKTAWLNVNALKKKQKLFSQCIWTLYPRCIKPRKKSIDPKDCIFYFWLDVRKAEYQENAQETYRAEIETALDGTLLSQKIRNGDKDKAFPVRFTFPKQRVAKINRFLYNNLFFELWGGPRYAAWHRTDMGIPSYIGTYSRAEDAYRDPRKNHLQNICGNQLSSLLASPLGDAGVILLAYICFAVIKNFFPSYRSLDENTPYMKAKKYIPEQIAVNIGSNPINIAENFARSFCDFFNMGEGAKIPVIDGVAVQRMPKKQTLLGVNEFEAKVLQPACVLWVNRIPTKNLVESGWILDLHLPSNADPLEICSFGENVVMLLTEAIHKVSLASYLGLRVQAWNTSVPILCQMQDDFLQATEKYNFSTDFDTELMSKPKVKKEDIKSIPADPVEYAEALFQKLDYDVVNAILDKVTEERASHLFVLREELKTIFSWCRRELRKCKSQSQIEKFSLQPLYKSAVQEISSAGSLQKAPKYIQNKAAYLLASLSFFERTCLPPHDPHKTRKRFMQAMVNFFPQNWENMWASDLLEKYISNTILSGRCARIRGKGSDQADIRMWYDPREQLFLLPSKTYYDALKSSPSNQAATKQVFEQKLVDEGTLYTVQRSNQVRRTFEIKVRQDAPRITVLKVRSENFSEKFFADAKIQARLRSLDSEDSSFRTKPTW